MKKLIPLALIFLPTLAFAQIPAFPMAFWGTVTVNGVEAPAGATVSVYAESVEVGKITVQEGGMYGYTEPTKQKLVVGEGSGELSFTIQAPSINSGVETGGASPVTHPEFMSGETIQKDIAFNIAEVTTGGGGGSSSSGGGGSSRKKVEQPKELVLGVASTTLSVEEQAIRESLLAKIEELKKLIQVLTAQMSTKNTNIAVYQFSNKLEVGDGGLDVLNLQKKLNSLGFTVSPSGPGAPGYETSYYGPATTAALKKFQCQYNIVCVGDPWTTGYGNFGPMTRQKMNSL